MNLAQLTAGLEGAIKDCAQLPTALDVLMTVSQFAAAWNQPTLLSQRGALTTAAVQRVYADLTAAGMSLPPQAPILALVEHSFNLLAAAQELHNSGMVPSTPGTPAPAQEVSHRPATPNG